MESKKQEVIRKTCYMAVLIIVSAPLFCGYVMDNGDIRFWLARIEECREALLMGRFCLFPSNEVVLACQGQYSSLNSNLWLMFPVMLRLFGISEGLACVFYMLLLNILALFSAKRMFSAIFMNRNTVLCGVVLYLTCPGRMYLLYDKANLGSAAAWAVIPLAIGLALEMCRGRAGWGKIAGLALSLALSGYADGVLMFLTIGVLMVIIIWYRKWRPLLAIVLGVFLVFPGAYYFWRYLLCGGMEAWNLPMQTISGKGYAVGQFFSSWVYRDNYPGLGLGLLLALLFFIWHGLTERDLDIWHTYGVWILVSCLFAWMSMKYFPWDIIQRLGAPLLRFVGLIETPGINFGFVSLGVSVLGGYGIECAQRQKNLFVKVGMPAIIILSAAGVALYICNTLVYNRLPLM